MAYLASLIADEHGGVIVETALLMVFVSIAGYAAFASLGNTVEGLADQGAGALAASD